MRVIATTATMHSAPSLTASASASVDASAIATAANEAAPTQNASAASPATGTTRAGDQALTPRRSGRAGDEAVGRGDRPDAGRVGLGRLLLLGECCDVRVERHRHTTAAGVPPSGVGVLHARARLPPRDVGAESVGHCLVSRSLEHQTLL